MTERRDFLKAATFLPLSMLGGSEALGADAPTTVVGQKSFEASAGQSDSAMPFANDGPIQEQPFPHYHLLGKPDSAANLFGEVRPSTWAGVKLNLRTGLGAAAHAQDPIHRWLAIFNTSFDVRAAGIVIQARNHIYQGGGSTVLRYEPQLYDGLLRAATVLLDRCLRYRVEMGQFEISGVSAAIGYLAFIKLKPLQRNFLVQSNSADIARIEKISSRRAAERYAEVFGIDLLFEEYQLQAKQIELSGSAAEASVGENKANFLTHLLEKQFHIQIDSQLAQFTRLFEPGSSSNFAERYLRLLSLVTEDLTDVYCKLYSASKGVQQVLGLTQVTVGLNSSINVNIPAFQTLNDVRSWVASVVPASAGHERAPDILDALVLWTRAVMRTLDTAAQYESEFTVSIPLTQPLAPSTQPIVPPADISAAFAPGSPTGTVTFTLPNGALPINATPVCRFPLRFDPGFPLRTDPA
jgi:hypothetical protein